MWLLQSPENGRTTEMRTLKRIGALVAAVTVLLAMTGCKKKEARGAKSAEELVTTVLEVINEDAEYSEIEDWMDWYGWIAFRLMEETDMKCDLPTCKAVVEDLDKDSDYIYEHHKDFVVTWKDANHENFDDDCYSLVAWKLYKSQIDEYLKAGGDFILEQFREFAPYDTDFDRDNLHEDKKHDVGYYSIEIDDENYHAIEIHYYIEDGRYICYSVNFVG